MGKLGEINVSLLLKELEEVKAERDDLAQRLAALTEKEKIKYSNDQVISCELELIKADGDENGPKAYFAYMRNGKRVRLRRTTTIVDTLGKRNLIHWASQMCGTYVRGNWSPEQAFGDFISRNWHPGQRYSEQQIRYILQLSGEQSHSYISMLTGMAEDYHEDYKNLTGDMGTEAHQWIERFLTTGEWPDTTTLRPEVVNSLRLFADFWSAHNYEVIAVEYRCYDVELEYGGTVDVIVRDRDTGEIVLLDWKTGSGVWGSYKIQVSAYYGALHKTSEYKPTKVFIVRIGREDAETQIQEVTLQELRLCYDIFCGVAKIARPYQRIDGQCYRATKKWKSERNPALITKTLSEREASKDVPA